MGFDHLRSWPISDLGVRGLTRAAAPHKYVCRSMRPVLVSIPSLPVFFLVLALLTGRMAWDDYKYAEISMGLGVPRWWPGM